MYLIKQVNFFSFRIGNFEIFLEQWWVNGTYCLDTWAVQQLFLWVSEVQVCFRMVQFLTDSSHLFASLLLHCYQFPLLPSHTVMMIVTPEPSLQLVCTVEQPWSLLPSFLTRHFSFSEFSYKWQVNWFFLSSPNQLLKSYVPILFKLAVGDF